MTEKRRPGRPRKLVEQPSEAKNGALGPKWEVEFDEPVVADGLDAGQSGGCEEMAPGGRASEGYGDNGLLKTTTPGIFINSAGIMVDKNGISLTFQKVKEADNARWGEILGKPLETPAELLKAVSLDPTKPLAMRIDAAKAAAPYTDRRKPQGHDGGEDGAPIMISVTKMRGLSTEELAVMERMVVKMLAAPTENDDENGN